MSLKRRIGQELLRCNNGKKIFVHRCMCGRMTADYTSEKKKFVNRQNDIKPFNEMPGPKGIYNIPFLGIALQFKPFSK
jgi:hypothetical protein